MIVCGVVLPVVASSSGTGARRVLVPERNTPQTGQCLLLFSRVTKWTRVCRACKGPTPHTRVVLVDERLGYLETPWVLTPLCPSLSRCWQPDLAADGRGLSWHDLLVSHAYVEGRAESCMLHRVVFQI